MQGLALGLGGFAAYSNTSINVFVLGVVIKFLSVTLLSIRGSAGSGGKALYVCGTLHESSGLDIQGILHCGHARPEGFTVGIKYKQCEDSL